MRLFPVSLAGSCFGTPAARVAESLCHSATPAAYQAGASELPDVEDHPGKTIALREQILDMEESAQALRATRAAPRLQQVIECRRLPS